MDLFPLTFVRINVLTKVLIEKDQETENKQVEINIVQEYLTLIGERFEERWKNHQ